MGFAIRRKGAVEDIRDTGSRRLEIQLSFAGRDWQTLQLEVAKPEADEIELVPVAVGIGEFGLDGPERVACLSLRFQVAQKLHAVILLETLLEDNLAPVRDAAMSIFTARGTHAKPPELVVPEAWREPYSASAAEIGADLPVDVDGRPRAYAG